MNRTRRPPDVHESPAPPPNRSRLAPHRPRTLRRHRRIVIERQEPRRLEIRELIVIDRPEERRRRPREKQQRQRNHDEQNVHAASAVGSIGRAGPRAGRSTAARPIRIAFRTTTSELTDIPSAASSGGTKPSAASGTAAKL